MFKDNFVLKRNVREFKEWIWFGKENVILE